MNIAYDTYDEGVEFKNTPTNWYLYFAFPFGSVEHYMVMAFIKNKNIREKHKKPYFNIDIERLIGSIKKEVIIYHLFN